MSIGANMTTREQSLAGVAIVALMLIGAYWYFLYSPKSEQLDALDQRIVKIESLNQRARRDVAHGSIDSLRAEVARDARVLETVQMLVPTRNEVPALLEDVSTAARRVGLDLASVEPLAVIGGDDFDTYRYKISVIGHYHAIGQFLTNVGSLRRIVAPVTLEVKPAVASNRRGQQNRVSAERPQLQSTFQIQTYVARAVPGFDQAAPLPELESNIPSLESEPRGVADAGPADVTQTPESGA